MLKLFLFPKKSDFDLKSELMPGSHVYVRLQDGQKFGETVFSKFADHVPA